MAFVAIDGWTVLSVLTTAVVLGIIASLIGRRVGRRDSPDPASADRRIGDVLQRRTLRAGGLLPADAPPDVDDSAGQDPPRADG